MLFTPFQKRVLLLGAVAAVVTAGFWYLLDRFVIDTRDFSPLTAQYYYVLPFLLWFCLLFLMNRVWHVIPTPEDGEAGGLAFMQAHRWSKVEPPTYKRALTQYLAASFEHTRYPKIRLAATDPKTSILWSYYSYYDSSGGNMLDVFTAFSVWRFPLPTSVRGELFFTTTVNTWPMRGTHLPVEERERVARRRFSSPDTPLSPEAQRLMHWYRGLGRHPVLWVKGRQATLVFTSIPSKADLELQYRLVEEVQRRVG